MRIDKITKSGNYYYAHGVNNKGENKKWAIYQNAVEELKTKGLKGKDIKGNFSKTKGGKFIISSVEAYVPKGSIKNNKTGQIGQVTDERSVLHASATALAGIDGVTPDNVGKIYQELIDIGDAYVQKRQPAKSANQEEVEVDLDDKQSVEQEVETEEITEEIIE